MNASLVDRIVEAVLYEGYLLYPYRPSVKTRHRWTFGGLLPRAWCEAERSGDRWTMECECLVEGTEATSVEVAARFLHLNERTSAELLCPVDYGPGHDANLPQPVETLASAGNVPNSWQEGTERRIELPGAGLGQLASQPYRHDFAFPATRQEDPHIDREGQVIGVLVRTQQPIEGSVELSAERVADRTWKLRVAIVNRTAILPVAHLSREEAMLRSLVSTHAVLVAKDGAFVSPTDPPASLKPVASTCRNVGGWPVLVGEPGERDTLLCSPIILPDYPQIAPESPGDLFDGTEIDEILSLRILTLTDEEKCLAASTDERARKLLERTELLANEQLLGLHGTFRDFPVYSSDPPAASRSGIDRVRIDTGEVRAGSRVRLRPCGRADPFDFLLAEKTATVVAIEQDYEDQILLAVTVDDDPGNDLGLDGKPGHRFFFRPEEVELLAAESEGATHGIPTELP